MMGLEGHSPHCTCEPCKRIGDSLGRVEILQDEVDSLQTKLDAFERARADACNCVQDDDQVAHIAALEAELAELKVSVNHKYWQGIRNDNIKLKSRIAALEAEVATTKQRLAGLRQQFKNLQAQLAAQPSCEDVCAAVENRLTTINWIQPDALAKSTMPRIYECASERATDAIRAAFADKTKCPNCKGEGRYTTRDNWGCDNRVPCECRVCPNCNGIGTAFTHVNNDGIPVRSTCEDCLGTGKVQITEENKS